MLVLPKESRKLFKEPFGILHRDIRYGAPGTSRAYGLFGGGCGYPQPPEKRDHSCNRCGGWPDHAFTVQPDAGLFGECIRVENPPGTITDDLVKALTYAVDHTPVTIIVNGEEDLAVIPLVIAAPGNPLCSMASHTKGSFFARSMPDQKPPQKTFSGSLSGSAHNNKKTE